MMLRKIKHRMLLLVIGLLLGLSVSWTDVHAGEGQVLKTGSVKVLRAHLVKVFPPAENKIVYSLPLPVQEEAAGKADDVLSVVSAEPLSPVLSAEPEIAKAVADPGKGIGVVEHLVREKQKKSVATGAGTSAAVTATHTPAPLVPKIEQVEVVSLADQPEKKLVIEVVLPDPVPVPAVAAVPAPVLVELRDPFNWPPELLAQLGTRDPEEKAFVENLVLSGVIWDEVRPMAVINNVLLKEGELLGDVVVRKIFKESVVVERDAAQHVLLFEDLAIDLGGQDGQRSVQ